MLVSRSEASETLSSLLGLEAMETEEEFEFPLPPALLLTGAPRSGKSTLVSSVLDGAKDDSVRVAVASCQQGSVHPKCIFECLLSQLLCVSRMADCAYSSPVKCDTLVDFVEILAEELGDEQCRIVVVLRNCEILRELDSNLLPGFLRLQELTELNLCVILLSRISFNKYLTPHGLPVPIKMELRPYTKEELATIIAEKIKNSDDGRYPEDNIPGEEFYLNYSRLILHLTYCSCNSVPQLLWLSQLHFKMYRQPVEKGEVAMDNVRALYRQIEGPLKESLATIHLRETSSKLLLAVQQGETSAPVTDRRLHVELPFHSKFLLIAAYLASYNPAKSDKRFFVKHHGKQRKTAASIRAKESRVSSQLTGPKSFPLDRLMAIFYSIVEEDVTPSANVLSQVASLVTLQFIAQTSSEDSLDQPKYKCLVGLNFITQISKQVDFEIHRYLYEFAGV